MCVVRLDDVLAEMLDRNASKHTASKHTASKHTASKHTASEHTAFEHTAFEHTAFEHTAFEHTAFEHTAGRHAANNGIRLIGVDGPSGSGKSTLAARIAARLDAPLIEIDDFVSWADFAGWWPRFDEQVLRPLLSGNDARYQVRDWENDEFGTSLDGWKTVVWSPVVVIEGVTCTRAATTDRLAYRIWIEAPEEVRLKRGLERDGGANRQLWLDWMREERQFFIEDATAGRADLRVNGDPRISHDPESEVVLLDGPPPIRATRPELDSRRPVR